MTATRTLRFIITMSKVPANGNFLLRDLPGSGGRVDLLCRCLAACFDWAPETWSLDELELIAIISNEKRMIFTNPDSQLPIGEKAWAQVIQDVLRGKSYNFVKVDSNSIEDTIEDLVNQPESNVWVLDENGELLTNIEIWRCTTQNSFMLGDHRGFDSRAQKAIEKFKLKRISLGRVIYLSSHCIATVISESEREL